MLVSETLHKLNRPDEEGSQRSCGFLGECNAIVSSVSSSNARDEWKTVADVRLTRLPRLPRAPFSPSRPGGPIAPVSPFSPGVPFDRNA